MIIEKKETKSIATNPYNKRMLVWQIQNTDTFDTSCLLRLLIRRVTAPSNSTPTTTCT